MERLARALNFPLDEPVQLGGNYRAAAAHAGIVSVSGQIPRVGTVVRVTGRTGEQVTLDQAQQGARICALRILVILHHQLGSLDRVAQVLQVGVYTQCTAEFTQLSEVADAASEVFHQVLGEAGAHARTSVGVYQLPKNAAVEVNALVAVT